MLEFGCALYNPKLVKHGETPSHLFIVLQMRPLSCRIPLRGLVVIEVEKVPYADTSRP